MPTRILHGDCRDHLKVLAAAGELFDGCVTDPPYHLTSIVERFGKSGAAKPKFGTNGAYARAARGFMGKEWDGGDVAFQVDMWRALFRVLKPGAHLLAFSATRTYHRMACAIEDAGFEIRDHDLFIHDNSEDAERFLDSLNDEQRSAFVCLIEQSPGELAWIYGSGMNKRGYLSFVLEGSLCRKIDGQNVYLDDETPMRREPPFRHPDADRLWGWAGGIKPAFEPIVVARKPLAGTEVATMLKHGVGVFNVDACRIEAPDGVATGGGKNGCQPLHMDRDAGVSRREERSEAHELGRWPANVMHDGSDDVLEAFESFGDRSGQKAPTTGLEPSAKTSAVFGKFSGRRAASPRGDIGSAARFFFSAKAAPDDQFGSKHPTIKPVSLIKYLADLIVPQGGRLIDPFAGTAPIVFARPDLDLTLIEREAEYVGDIERRVAYMTGGGMTKRQEIAKRKASDTKSSADGLFGFLSESGQ